jgi:hypothetical protein
MKETEAKWNPFTATQLVMTQRLGFDWDARIQMAPGVNAFVHDLTGGQNSLECLYYKECSNLW